MKSSETWLFGGLIVAVALVGVAMLNGQQASVVGSGTTTTGGTPVGGACPVTNTNPISFTAYDKESAQTSVTGFSTYIQDNSGNIFSTTTSFAPGTELNVFVYNGTNYYGTKKPNAFDPQPVTTVCGATGVRSLLAKKGNFAATTYNKDGTVNGLTTGNQSITNGQTVTLRFEPEETSTKAWWSNPELNYIEVGLLPENNTIWDWSQSSINGEGVTQVAMGTQMSADNVKKAFRIPKAIGPFQTLYGYTATLTALVGVQYEPTSTYVSLKFYDADYFIDQMGNVKDGVETDLGVDVGQANQVQNISIS